eukprot:1304370-Rhodomonas_salina.1
MYPGSNIKSNNSTIPEKVRTRVRVGNSTLRPGKLILSWRRNSTGVPGRAMALPGYPGTVLSSCALLGEKSFKVWRYTVYNPGEPPLLASA